VLIGKAPSPRPSPRKGGGRGGDESVRHLNLGQFSTSSWTTRRDKGFLDLGPMRSNTAMIVGRRPEWAATIVMLAKRGSAASGPWATSKKPACSRRPAPRLSIRGAGYGQASGRSGVARLAGPLIPHARRRSAANVDWQRCSTRCIGLCVAQLQCAWSSFFANRDGRFDSGRSMRLDPDHRGAWPRSSFAPHFFTEDCRPPSLEDRARAKKRLR